MKHSAGTHKASRELGLAPCCRITAPARFCRPLAKDLPKSFPTSHVLTIVRDRGGKQEVAVFPQGGAKKAGSAEEAYEHSGGRADRQLGRDDPGPAPQPPPM